jgi:hypothetical protein
LPHLHRRLQPNPKYPDIELNLHLTDKKAR